ncbi:MAG: hypothetical protein JNL47_04465, partial [Bacteroidia bacterium]|nr:hypothetical protein [Bacteroidia bacterium]
MKRFNLSGFVLCICIAASAQNRNLVWCFGDSSGIDFNNITTPVPIATGMDARGSCCSIADTSGNLLFYASGSDLLQIPYSESVIVRNNLNQILQNGDSLVGTAWYREHVITDMPAISNQFYLFSVGVTNNYGFWYSVIDMSQNSGMGAVIQKNVQLLNFKCTDGMTAIKHGNGRDWWVLFRRWDTVNDNFYKYLVTPAGISSLITQSIGSATDNNNTRIQFSHDGNKMVIINYRGLMEIFDFNRCTGIISNPVTIHPEPTWPPYNEFTFCEFSPSGRFLYVTSYWDTCYLYQYDLLSPAPAATRITLDTITNDLIGIGSLKLAPDGKIYLTHAWECTAFPYCYPYPDSVYNTVNMYLSVINYPDSLGSACGYAPFSFYLGGKRTYYGLPNNPDYELPTLAGSPCDTLTGLTPGPSPKERGAELFATWVSSWQKLFVNAQNLKGKKVTVEV